MLTRQAPLVSEVTSRTHVAAGGAIFHAFAELDLHKPSPHSLYIDGMHFP